MMLDRAVRRRGLAVLLADMFLMMAGFFMLVPLLSVYYVERLGFSAAAIGLVLAIRQLTQQGLTLGGGALADRWGAKGVIGWGLLLRAVSFAGLAWAHSFTTLLLLCILAALGGALFDAPSRAAIAALTEPIERARFYSLSGVVGGVGMALGPFVGALLLRTDFALVCFASACLFAVAFVLTMVWLPPIAVALDRQPMGRGIVLALQDRPFVVFTLLLCGFWFLWVQLAISLPLAAQRWGVPEVATPVGAFAINGVALIYALNAGMTIIFQYPLLRLIERWLRPLPIIVLGVALMATGLGLIAIAHNLGMLLMFVAVFALGALLVHPTLQTVTSQMAHHNALGSYFGFSALALAFGGGVGNYVGGWLYDTAARIGWPPLPWLVFGGLGLSVAVGLAVFDRAHMRIREQQAQPFRPSASHR